MLTLSKCSEEKFRLLYQGARGLKGLWGATHHWRQSESIDINNQIDYRQGARIIRSDNNYTDGYAYQETDKADTYLVNNTIISGVLAHLTQIFVNEGVQTIYISDGKEHMLIDEKGEVIVHRKSGRTLDFLSKVILKELKDIENVVYSDGIVRTKHFTGEYRMVENHYRIVTISGFHEKRVEVFNRDIDSREDYEAIIEIDTNKIIDNKMYRGITEVRNNTLGIMDGLYCCIYTKRYRVYHKIYDLRNNENVLLNNIFFHILDGYYAHIVRVISSEGREAITVVRFNKDKRLFEAIIPELENVWLRINSKPNKTDRNILISRTVRSQFEAQDYSFNKVVRLYLKSTPQELLEQGKTVEDIINEEPRIEWCDKSIEKTVRNRIGETVNMK